MGIDESYPSLKNEYPAYEKVKIARDEKRPRIDEYIEALFEDFIECKGDRVSGDDKGIMGGIGTFHGMPVTVIGHRKGKNIEENALYNFGMAGPCGYRKALRLMEQAEKFNRPVITFIDTPGAYPGMNAEENGQSTAIATALAKMSALEIPIITVITGEGNSGGALAIAVANSILMFENAVYSILSPEGFASILWKDAKRSNEACELMKMTAEDLKASGIVDEVIKEPVGGIGTDKDFAYRILDKYLMKELKTYEGMPGKKLATMRYEKFRSIS